MPNNKKRSAADKAAKKQKLRLKMRQKRQMKRINHIPEVTDSPALQQVENLADLTDDTHKRYEWAIKKYCESRRENKTLTNKLKEIQGRKDFHNLYSTFRGRVLAHLAIVPEDKRENRKKEYKRMTSYEFFTTMVTAVNEK